MHLTRRSIVRTGAVAALSPVLDRFGMPVAGTFLRYARRARRSASGSTACRCSASSSIRQGFKHFDYVNPKAPKGGTVRMIAFGTFDNFNEVIAGLKGSIAAGVGMISDTLLVSALDEVSTEYGLIAEAVSHPPDFCVGHVPLARRGALPRRQAGHRRGRDLLHGGLQEAQSDDGGLLSPRGEGGEDRRARGHLHLRRARQPRDAA